MSDNWSSSESGQTQSVGYSFWAEQISKENRSNADGRMMEQNASVQDTDTALLQDTDTSVEAAAAREENDAPNASQENYLKENTPFYPRNYSYMNGAIPEEPVKKPKNGRIRKVFKFAASALVFGLIAGASFIGFQHVYYQLNPGAKPIIDKQKPGRTIPTIDSTPPAQVTTTDESLVATLVEQVEPSVVTITSTFIRTYSWFGQQFSEETSGGGSGIIVGQNDIELLIATNSHVVEGATTIEAAFVDGSKGLATIKGRDSVADLAIISVPLDSLSSDTKAAIKIAALGDSGNVKVGEMVIAIGNALGYGQSVTVGYVSAKDRKVKIEDNTMILLQTDAAINPGNSGGALINGRGEVIGINSIKYAANEVEGIGFAIPISNAYPILNEFMNREVLKEEEKGYLGISIKNVTEELSTLYQWPSGVLVYGVTKGGPADLAGILVQDIITKINGTTVTDMDQLKERVNSLRIGTEVTVTLQRYQDGTFTELEFKVTLAANLAPTPTPTPTAPNNSQGTSPD